MKAILTGSTVVFFAYVGFDAVANSAEESKRPQVCVSIDSSIGKLKKVSTTLIFVCLSVYCLHFSLQKIMRSYNFLVFLFFGPLFQRDLPIGILASVVICAALYIAVCLVITGMLPYKLLGEDAPLAEAFKSKGLKYVSILISIGAVAGLTTTLLVGLYVQVGHFI